MQYRGLQSRYKDMEPKSWSTDHTHRENLQGFRPPWPSTTYGSGLGEADLLDDDKVTQTEQITARTRQGSPLGFPQAQPRFGYGLDRGEEGH